ncbi:neurogenic locus notch homolog protein 4 [Drosophila mauritiana]|uniref:Delta-like protein n=1 Tax=Drosophila mauritiana TaxID=7226 RepID=A0A6P8L9D6_DROMA|nr:neurogenic locus notch homolog protein 4 [Drosophila mauritiana]
MLSDKRAALLLVTAITALKLEEMNAYRRNFDARQSSNSNIPLWKQRACEKSQKQRQNAHYVCDEKGDFKCLPGWQGDLCQVPMCRRGCDPMNGYCQRPGECRCRIGYSGELCDKCIPLPGCQHGGCTKPFECICKPGWAGLFCTEPSCRTGCHSTRGYCEAPGECRCRIGYAGRTCSECATMPGCQHGTCNKPLECLCLPGYTGLLCQTPICDPDCSKQHGYCRKPGECRCKVGWTGSQCDKCFPYPGCANGDCEAPWECNCHPGWGGMLCDEKLTYCVEHPDTCENGGKCTSLSREDGSYQCQCRQGFLGKNCEIRDDFLLTSEAPPRITPPTPAELELELDGELDQNGQQHIGTGVPDDSAPGDGLVGEKLPAGNEPERRKNDTAANVAAAGAGAEAGLMNPLPGNSNATRTTLVVATGTGSHNATNEALSAVTTRRATPIPLTSGEKAVKGNATSVTAATGPQPRPPPPIVASQEQTIANLAPAGTGTATAAPTATTAATSVTSHKDKPNVADEEEDEDDEDDEEDEDGEYDEEEDEDEDDEEDDSDQLIPNII